MGTIHYYHNHSSTCHNHSVGTIHYHYNRSMIQSIIITVTWSANATFVVLLVGGGVQVPFSGQKRYCLPIGAMLTNNLMN